MKSALKIIVPILFVGAIGIFVAYKSGAFNPERKTITKPKPALRVEPEEVPQKEPPIQPASQEKKVATEVVAPSPKKERVFAENVEEIPDTIQIMTVEPTVMPSSKSIIMTNPTFDRNILKFDKQVAPPKQVPKKRKTMSSSKSGILINP